MTVVTDASVVVRWYVDQPGHEAAVAWFGRFVSDPGTLVAPDLLRFELFGALCRLQPRRREGWAVRSFARFDRLGMRLLPTTLPLFRRAAALAAEVPMGGYDAVYLALAEELGIRWLTADGKVLRRLEDDPRIEPLEPAQR